MKTKLLYNDSCNICRTEINHYKKLSESNQFEWIDVSDGNEACDLTKQSRNSLYRRLHVIENNEIISGAKAFLYIWKKIPRYKPLYYILKLPIIFTLFHFIYEMLAILLYYKNKIK